MEKSEIEQLVQPFVGKNYRINRKTTRLDSFSVLTTTVHLNFSDEIVPVPLKEIEVYIQQNLTGTELVPANVMPTTMINTTGVELANLIKENIAKIQKDPGYIPQASAINDQVKTFIDLAKTEVEMYKAINR